MQAESAKKSRVAAVVIHDALRDQVRDKVRAFSQCLKNLLKMGGSMKEDSREVLDRLTFILSMENGFIWNDRYASTQLNEVSKNKQVSASE